MKEPVRVMREVVLMLHQQSLAQFGDADVIEADAFEALSGLTSLPFPRPERLGKGETWRVAVKVLDPRGNEGLRVLTLKD